MSGEDWLWCGAVVLGLSGLVALGDVWLGRRLRQAFAVGEERDGTPAVHDT